VSLISTSALFAGAVAVLATLAEPTLAVEKRARRAPVVADAAPLATRPDADPAAAQTAAAAAPSPPPDPAIVAFRAFCDEWMLKLSEREKFNRSRIRWDSGENWVQGDYIGYTREHHCSIERQHGVPPVGKIRYREIRYEQRGATLEEATASLARPVETTEVTEIFRYGEGKWIY
jgi:hypothetical protein